MSDPKRPMVRESDRETATELQATHIGDAFRYLSDEHQETKRRDDVEVTWQAVEYRLRFGKRLRPGFWGSPLFGPGARPLSKGKLGMLAAAAAVCLAAGGAALLHAFPGADPAQAALDYDIRDAAGHSIGAAPAPGTSQLLATEEETKQVRFSDSSVIELRPYTTLRVSVLESGTVVARLVQGALEADVHHQERTDYRFQAGDYEVKVVGTSFDLAFEPQPSRFDLDLHEGRVIVADGAGQTRVLQAGQALHLPTETHTASTEPSADQAAALRSASVPQHLSSAQEWSAQGNSAQGNSAQGNSAQEWSAQGTATHGAPSYRELASKGQFQTIVASARRSGVDRVLASKSPAELHELAQAARYTGQVALSEKVFSHLATQHARSTEGRSAAFFRGRLAEDGGRFQQAQQHYRTYLAQGGGTYAAEALGRELTLVQKLKGPAAARPLASEYLRRFPRGAYRDLAQSLAQSPGARSPGAASQSPGATAPH